MRGALDPRMPPQHDTRDFRPAQTADAARSPLEALGHVVEAGYDLVTHRIELVRTEMERRMTPSS